MVTPRWERWAQLAFSASYFRMGTFGPAYALAACAAVIVGGSGCAAGPQGALYCGLGLLVLLLYVLWRDWGWFIHLYLPFDPDRTIKLHEYQARNQTTWKNKPIFLDSRKSLPGTGGSENFTVIVDWTTPDAVKKREVESCLERKDRIVLWRNFLSADFMAKWGRPSKDCLKDNAYTFFVNTQGNAQELAERNRRPLKTFQLHDAMDRMEQDEDLYMGFSTDFAENNAELRLDIEAELTKLNTYGPMFKDPTEYYSHAFLYYGARFQTPQHAALAPDFSLQIANSKLWRFVHPDHTPKMDAIRGDVPGVLLSRHILVEGTGLPYQDVVVGPGDLLIFPEHWWHEVHNLEDGWGMMIGLRHLADKCIPHGLFSSKWSFYHKWSSTFDVVLNKMADDMPENLKGHPVGVCFTD